LTEFKTTPEQTIATALGNVTIDEDELSDDYDFMDDDDGAAEERQRQRQQKRVPQYKYKEALRQLANRQIDTITVDLDDLQTVCYGA
jgi:DNA replication licensing factor MCM7